MFMHCVRLPLSGLKEFSEICCFLLYVKKWLGGAGMHSDYLQEGSAVLPIHVHICSDTDCVLVTYLHHSLFRTSFS